MMSRMIFILLTLILLELNWAQNLSNQVLGGEYYSAENFTECISKEYREKILKTNRETISQLKLNKLINSVRSNNNLFEWPFRNDPKLSDYSYYAIASFVDHDPNYPNHLLDYFGGTRSYDRENGYNHQGTDIFPWPFAWYVMDNDLVQIVSMNSGIIIGKEDGNYDRNCGFNEDNWNAIYILHDNGFIAWYGHLKNGSLTAKTIGDTVKSGEYLGIVGSSGSSFSPHLHLEMYDLEYNLIDPWEGPYNITIKSSLWENQPPYYDSKINKLATHSGWPVFPDCPQQEILNLQNEFEPGDTVYLITYYQDQLKDQISEFEVRTPNNLSWTKWEHYIEDDYYTASYWGWWIILPEDALPGEWEFLVNYENVDYRHTFIVNSTTSLSNIELPRYFNLHQNYPNPFNPVTRIDFSIPKQAFVNLKVFDILGREVAALVNEKVSAGKHSLDFDGSSLSSGIYFYRLITENHISIKKMLLIK